MAVIFCYFTAFSAFCLLLSAFCFLPSAFCFLLSAFCLLPSAFCFLPSAFCLNAFCLIAFQKSTENRTKLLNVSLATVIICYELTNIEKASVTKPFIIIIYDFRKIFVADTPSQETAYGLSKKHMLANLRGVHYLLSPTRWH